MLINFPITKLQTNLMEEALTGKQIVDEVRKKGGSLLEIIDVDWDAESKSNNLTEKFRQSRILNFPNKHCDNETYVTPLTAFIKLYNEAGKNLIYIFE